MKQFWCLVYVLMILSLCSCVAELKTQPITNDPFLNPTFTSTQEYLTNTPIVELQTASLTPAILKTTERHTPTVAKTSTPVPILSKPLASEKLRSIITTNFGCDFPCWAGLTPGISKPMDVFNLLSSMSILSDFNLLEKTGGSIGYSFPLDNFQIQVVAAFRTNPQDENVQVISLSAFALSNETLEYVFDAQAFRDLFERYLLKNILKQYGKPSEVRYAAYILPEGSNFNSASSSLTILYPDKGIFIQYMGPVDRKGDIVRTCLNKVSINLWLLSPADQNRYGEILSSSTTGWSDLVRDFDLQEVTGMSLDAFYEKFSSGDDQCIETPASIWPGP